MALNKKYANLPDVDEAPDIYETPELVEDASTVQTTASPEPSENGDDRLDRQRLDRDSARRRFEPSIISARDTNFSDTIAAGARRSYKTRSRRKRRAGYGAEDDRDESESEDETVNERIARLRREAEEIRLEIASQKAEGKAADEGSKSHRAEQGHDAMNELDSLLKGLRPASNTGIRGDQEEMFLQNLSEPSGSTNKKADTNGNTTTSDGISPSTTAAIAAFSDRLTALETVLGLSTIDTSTSEPSILPTLDILSRQLNTLTTTLAPKPPSTTTTAPQSLPNLDAISTRIKSLTLESDKLTSSRKSAIQSLSDLNEARIQYTTTRHSRTHSSSHHQPNPLQTIETKESALHSDLFLSEQSSKITALYQLLPSITSLQPLLPVVLDRLRSLNVIHAGAADARGELDEALRQQQEMKRDVATWREAVEGVEKQMSDMKTDMKENVEVVGGMVRGVEQRIETLRKQ